MENGQRRHRHDWRASPFPFSIFLFPFSRSR
jgi:hypothetical protein